MELPEKFAGLGKDRRRGTDARVELLMDGEVSLSVETFAMVPLLDTVKGDLPRA